MKLKITEGICRVCGIRFMRTTRRRKLCGLSCRRIFSNNRAIEWYNANKERKQEYDKKYAPSRRKENREASKRWREAHPGRKNHDTALRRNAKRKRVPAWADLCKIKEIYENCPDGYHVDHIIPLRGKLVSGLHVPENLQYLTVEDNLKKANHYSWGE